MSTSLESKQARKPGNRWYQRVARHIQRPYLDVWLDIGLLQIKTELLADRYETLTKTYIGLRVTVLHKWGGSFRLYSVPRC